jgi:hypothetical protein
MSTLPQFMQPLQPVKGGEAGGHAVGPVIQTALPGVRMSGQEEVNWCWSAVTQAIMLSRQQRTLSQQDIAGEHARRSGKAHSCEPPHRRQTSGQECADDSCQASCNDAHILRIIMGEQGCFNVVLSEGSAPSFDEIKGEIDGDKPVACRVQWNAGGGHFILVSGWTIGADGKERVHILDPASNEGGQSIVERVLPYATFATAYSQSGLTGWINYSYSVI